MQCIGLLIIPRTSSPLRTSQPTNRSSTRVHALRNAKWRWRDGETRVWTRILQHWVYSSYNTSRARHGCKQMTSRPPAKKMRDCMDGGLADGLFLGLIFFLIFKSRFRIFYKKISTNGWYNWTTGFRSPTCEKIYFYRHLLGSSIHLWKEVGTACAVIVY